MAGFGYLPIVIIVIMVIIVIPVIIVKIIIIVLLVVIVVKCSLTQTSFDFIVLFSTSFSIIAMVFSRPGESLGLRLR